jgi:Putative DNA-binding domain
VPQLTDSDILTRLRNIEDSTVERKSANDYRDCLKTAVAFSNSLPIDDPGCIFVGVSDDGTVQEGSNLEALQKNVSKELSKIYPPIYPQMKVMRDANAEEFLAIIVRGSENRPHFAGPSYVRDGTQTVAASESQFKRLIAERNNKAYEVVRWKGKTITFTQPMRECTVQGTTTWTRDKRVSATVIDSNQHYLTLESVARKSLRASYPLRTIELNYDNARERLELLLLEGNIPDWPAHL